MRWVISIIHCLNRTQRVRTDMIHSYAKTTGRNWGRARKTGRPRQIGRHDHPPGGHPAGGGQGPDQEKPHPRVKGLDLRLQFTEKQI